MRSTNFDIFKDFKDCIDKNKDKNNPQAFCAHILFLKHKKEQKWTKEILEDVQFQCNIQCNKFNPSRRDCKDMDVKQAEKIRKKMENLSRKINEDLERNSK